MKNTQNILGISFHPSAKNIALEKIQICLRQRGPFCHIVSLNPEIAVLARYDHVFRKILSESDIQLCDGVGIALAGSILGYDVPERVPGVDLMRNILDHTKEMGLRIMLIGGKGDVAERLALCYSKFYPKLTFRGIEGYKDILSPTKQEEQELNHIVADYKPQLVFVAFGSPSQEKWIDQHKVHLNGSVCMGVGGSFDFELGAVKRAPLTLRVVGLEWLYRLMVQPWRLRRQLRLIHFIWLFFLQRIGLQYE